MWLEWEPAAMAVFLLVAVVVILRPRTSRAAVVVTAFARELAIMFTLYAVLYFVMLATAEAERDLGMIADHTCATKCTWHAARMHVGPLE